MWSPAMKCTLLLVITGVNAAPALSLGGLLGRGIPTTQFDQLSLFAQYSGAAYCFDNVNGQAKKLQCGTGGGSCPTVEKAATNITASFEVGHSKTRGYVATDDTNRVIVVSFQGTSLFDKNPEDIITDISLNRVKTNFCGTANTNDGCEIHEGFRNAAIDAQDVVKRAVSAALATKSGYTVVVAGHSLGAAVAALTATLLRNGGQAVDLYTYGQPRLGTVDISNFIQSQAPSLGSNYRVTHFNDIVPKLPFHQPDNWDHYYPEYFINIDEGTQTADTIDIVTGSLFVRAGNEGTNSQFGPLVDAINGISAHGEYLGGITGCSTEKPGTKRGIEYNI